MGRSLQLAANRRSRDVPPLKTKLRRCLREVLDVPGTLEIDVVSLYGLTTVEAESRFGAPYQVRRPWEEIDAFIRGAKQAVYEAKSEIR